MTNARRLLTIVSVLTVVSLAAQAPSALASSGSITNVHAVGEQVEATYTTNFDSCGEFSCAWYPYAVQFPASQSCSPGSANLTYVGNFHSTAGSETATDTFYPAFTGAIKICLYASGTEDDYLVAEAIFTYTPPSSPPSSPPAPTPPSSSSGSITNLRSVRGTSKMLATYTTNFSMCTSYGYCGWFSHALQYPASQSCNPYGTDLTYVGNIHSDPGSEREVDDFYPKYSAGRLCLYAYHASADYFIAEALYFHGPAPSQRSAIVVDGQVMWFYFPKGCVQPGSEVQLRVAGAATRIKRVVFSVDRSRRTDRRASWKASFSTSRLGRASVHTAVAKITFGQRGRTGKFVRRIVKTFRTC